MSRDNARTPMQWDGSEHGGFTTGTPWISVNPNTAEINAAQLDDPDSVFHHYRRLIDLRHTAPVDRQAPTRHTVRPWEAHVHRPYRHRLASTGQLIGPSR